MIPRGTPTGTKVYLCWIGDDDIFAHIEEVIIGSWRDGVNADYFAPNPLGSRYILRHDAYLTKKEAAAQCLKQHHEVLEECWGEMEGMIRILNQED